MKHSRSRGRGSSGAAATRLLIASAASVLAVGVLAACSRQAPPVFRAAPATTPPAALQQSGWESYANQFIEDYFRARPMFAVQAGRHEFDGDMPDLSAAGIAREVARLKMCRTQVDAFDPATLAPEQRFERAYLLNVIDTDLFWLDRAKFPFKNPAWYIDLLDPNVYLTRKYAPLAARMQGYIGYARAIPQIAANIRANLRGPLPRTFIERGISGFGGYAEFYRRDVPQAFAGVADPSAQAQLAEADEAAAEAMDRLKSWLESRRRHATG